MDDLQPSCSDVDIFTGRGFGPGTGGNRTKNSRHRGRLHPGPSPFIPPLRFTRYLAACVARLKQFTLDGTTVRYLNALQHSADGQATLDEVRHCLQAMNNAEVTGQRSTQAYLTFPALSACETPLAAGIVSWGISGAYAWTVAKALSRLPLLRRRRTIGLNGALAVDLPMFSTRLQYRPKSANRQYCFARSLVTPFAQ